jgi:ribokinase
MITVFGSVMLDLIGRVSRFPVPGETVMGSTFATSPGGKGANQALAARRAGARVRMVAATGRDGMGDQALALLKSGGVELRDVRRIDAAQGVAMIFVDPDGENEIGILPGANSEIGPDDAETALAGLGETDVLIVQQEVPQEATMRALALARLQGVTSILNTAPFLDTTSAVAGTASIVVANETEFALLSGSAPENRAAAMREWARTRRQTIIVTLGADGAEAVTGEGRSLAVRALAVDPVDTVGAGDTFVGYLAAGLDAGVPLELAMRRAAVAASLACTRPGAQPAIPQVAEVDAALSSGSR